MFPRGLPPSGALPLCVWHTYVKCIIESICLIKLIKLCSATRCQKASEKGYIFDRLFISSICMRVMCRGVRLGSRCHIIPTGGRGAALRGILQVNSSATSVTPHATLSTNAPSSSTLTITRPDDWHLHVRDGEAMRSVVPHTARHYGRAVIMPNLTPPVTTVKAVSQCAIIRERIYLV